MADILMYGAPPYEKSPEIQGIFTLRVGATELSVVAGDEDEAHREAADFRDRNASLYGYRPTDVPIIVAVGSRRDIEIAAASNVRGTRMMQIVGGVAAPKPEPIHSPSWTELRQLSTGRALLRVFGLEATG